MSVKVAIRVRPFNQREKFLSCTCCVQMKNNTTVVSDERDRKKKKNFFTFDYSFWSHDGFQVTQNGMLVPINDQYISQQHVYDELGRDVVANALMGYNCCLFAYGQTGSGKSYSMIGFGVNKGIIPMACAEIFRTIANKHQKGHLQYEVSLSMLEIYNEKVQDLFVNPNKRPNNGLKIRENKTLGVYVEGITKYKVNSYEQIEMKMEMGSKNRSLASTLMNEYSSRAHTIVMIQFIQKQFITSGKMSKKTSQINLVDLAGSERVAKTGINDNKDRLKEASLINKSLHTLGRCIEALAQLSQGKTNNIQVPYRDSVLTRILENALGGNSKTTMICAISPANDNYDETLSTLRYADKTKKIKNKPVINQSAVDRLIRQLRQQNNRLKGLLQTSPESSKESKSNVKASIRQVQRQIRQNLQSFAINGQVIQQQDSLMMTTFVDLQNQDINNLSMQYNSNSCQVYITNLNQDEFLSYKVKYSCQNNLTITNKYKNTSSILVDEEKLVLCGLGIEPNHAKIFRQNNQFYIETLNEKSSQYTLVNGQQINHTSRLYHNDRIIFGINSVFIFKNFLNKQQRLVEKYTDQSQIDYEFAVNERQFAMENISLLSSRGSPIRNSRMERSRIDMRQSIELRIQNQMKQKLSEIEKQFQFLVLENDEKSKKKQQDHFKMLLDIEKQKEQEKQKLQDQLKDKEEKLKEREYQTIQLKNNQQQLEKLKKKLEIYQQKRKNTENKVQSQKQNKVNQQEEEEEEEELLLDTQVNNVVKTDETNNTTSGKVKLQFTQLYSIQIDGKNEVEKLKFTHQEGDKEIEQKIQMKNEQLRKKSEEQLSVSISDLIKEKKDNEQSNSLENERDTLLIEEQNFQNEENDNKIKKQNNKNKERISSIILYQNQFDENKLNNNGKQIKNTKRRQTVDFNLSVSDIDINDFDQQNSYFNLVNLETQKERQLSEKIKLLEDKINNLQCAVQHETSVVQNIEVTKQQSSNVCKNSQKIEQQLKIEKQLIIQCNNQNIIKERNTSIHKKKRQIEDLTKIWYRKEKVELQKDLLVLIPMLQRFNLMAREMKKLIQGKISIDYKHFTNYQIIQILRNYTNSKNKQPTIIIEIIIENYLEGRIYKWSIQTFRNRYQIAEQMFQIYLQNENKNNINNNQYSFDNDKNSDPFWDPIYYIPQGISYLSLQCLLYHMQYNDYISIVYHTQIMAKLQIKLKPILKLNNENIKKQINIENNQFSYQINNPRNYLQKELYFDLYIQSITFEGKNNKNNNIKKFYISYELLQKDYKNLEYKTLEIQYDGQKEEQNINYMRRHYYKNITQRTLAYLIDCPIKFIFYTIRDFNQDLFNHSFTTSEINSGSNYDNLKNEKDNQSMYSIENIKSKQNDISTNMMDFTRKKKISIFYENTQMIKNIDENYTKEQNKRKKNNYSNLSNNKQKQCSIY